MLSEQCNQVGRGSLEKVRDIDEMIVAAIRRIIRAIDLNSHQMMDSCGLTGPQLATLRALSRDRASNARDLARLIHVSQATMSGILERLERAGHITRSRNGADRRSVDIVLTAGGREAIAAAPPYLQARFVAELSKLKDWEQTQILATLQRVAHMLNADELEAAPHLITGPECT